jgi:hypothetical protein
MLAVPILIATACYFTTTAARAKPGNEALEWQKTLTVEAKVHTSLAPRAILSQIRADADPDECGDPAPKERTNWLERLRAASTATHVNEKWNRKAL